MTREQAEKTIRDRVAKATHDGAVVYSEHKIQCAIATLLGEELPAEPEESTEETPQERLERALCKGGDPTGGMWM